MTVAFAAPRETTSTKPSARPARQALRGLAGPDLASVRVRVREALPSVRVRGMDLQIRDAAGADRGYEHVTQWELYCRNGRVRARGSRGNDVDLDLAAPVSFRARGGFVSVIDAHEDAQFNGEIRIVTSGFLCEVVNVLPTEKYLEGVVNSEFSSKWSPEAVSAQVVAARSYAAAQMRVARAQGAQWDLDSTTADQVYHGTAREDAQAARLVRRSKGLALVTQAGEQIAPLKAFYHSTCGGTTDLPQNVWGGKIAGFSKRVACGFCRISPRYRWSFEVDRDEVQSRVRSALIREGRFRDAGSAAIRAQLVSMEVAQKDSFGRVSQVATLWQVPGVGPRRVSFSGPRLRDWLGSSGRTSSSRFDLTETHAGFKLSGRGFGHGVGLCQWGAKGMGDYGYKMSAILKHYYPNAKLAKLW